NLIALEKIDRSPLVAFEARVEKLVRVWEARPVGKGKFHLIFVGVANRDHSVARPHRASHPLPFLDYLPVGLQDALADASERFAAPVGEVCDQHVNALRWIHWMSMAPVLVPFSCGQFRCRILLSRSFRNKSSQTWPFHIQSPGQVPEPTNRVAGA